MESNGLPNNVDGYRTTFTCELCGFEPKTKNKYRERKHHLVLKHFRARIDEEIPTAEPFLCPSRGCKYLGTNKQSLLRHSIKQHNLLKMLISESLAKKGIVYPATDVNKRWKRKHSDPSGQKMLLVSSPDSRLEGGGEAVPRSMSPILDEWKMENLNNPETELDFQSSVLKEASSIYLGGLEPQSRLRVRSDLTRFSSIDSLDSNIHAEDGIFSTMAPSSFLTSRQPDLILSPFGNVLNLQPSHGHDPTLARGLDSLNLENGSFPFVHNLYQGGSHPVAHQDGIGYVNEPRHTVVVDRELDFLDVIQQRMGIQL